MSYFNFPYSRKEYPGIENPVFVSDIVASDEAAIAAVKAISGMNDTDFAIISGLDYVLGIPNTYTAGVYYLNGVFYYQSSVFNEGLYLTPAITTTFPEAFTDGTPRNIYILYGSGTSATPSGNTPIFNGDMDVYRIGLKYTRSILTSLIATQADLQPPAFDPYGQVANTVCAGDDSRIVAIYNNVLLLDNTNIYVPSGDYNPSTKKYADDHGGNILARGTYHIGDADPVGGGALQTIPIGATLTTTNYAVIFSIISLSATPNDDTFFLPTIRTKGTSSFTMFFVELTHITQNVSIDFIIYAL